MTQPDDSLLHEELVDTNRELVAINRQIAESLANLERLYAEDFRSRQETQQAMKAMLAGFKPGWREVMNFALPAIVYLALIISLFLPRL